MLIFLSKLLTFASIPLQTNSKSTLHLSGVNCLFIRLIIFIIYRIVGVVIVLHSRNVAVRFFQKFLKDPKVILQGNIFLFSMIFLNLSQYFVIH